MSKLDYYRTITLLFRRVGHLKGAVKFTLAAIAQAQAAETAGAAETGKLWTTLFELFSDLGMWSEAYVTVLANPIAASSIAALRTLAIGLVENVHCLCDLPLVGSRNDDDHDRASASASPAAMAAAAAAGKRKTKAYYLAEVENALLWHCDHISVEGQGNPYLPLYVFHTHNNKHASAAQVMWKYALRAREHMQVSRYSHTKPLLSPPLSPLFLSVAPSSSLSRRKPKAAIK